ncbi:hypothetical protein CJ030_MR6G003939 [Morella rubra]|uniref:GRF-type domain-containing protein n=1 Tax=Morella rubra TaxID=262757 RepID=A0A6A1V9X0_9ROSI|nr:hypothetical protein CJ030_MR6G003938 [Morella rubra]KAB1209604.1 hypothetical protein CJ030_MR6G003939 [Morella rubra]
MSTIACTDEKFGRHFWACVKYKDEGHCNYFAWRDPKMCAYGGRVIRQLQAMRGQMLGKQSSWKSIQLELRQQN